MKERELLLLIEVVDDLLRLNDVIKNLGGLGYQERFHSLDNVYEVIKYNSVFANFVDEDVEIEFYRIVEEFSESPKKRLEILLGKNE